MTSSVAVTEAAGYRQEYRRLGTGERGYRRQIFRVADGDRMYAGPGTDPDSPPTSHPEWVALPREERLAIRSMLDAIDEQSGIADYLSERASRDAVARGARSRGLDPRDWRGREADDARRDASQVEYELVLSGDLPAARGRLDRVLRADRDDEALRRLVEITGADGARDVALLAVRRGLLAPDRGDALVHWVPGRDPRWTSRAGVVGIAGGWAVESGLVPLGLAGIAGLRPDGTLGPVVQDERQIGAWRTILGRATRPAGRGAP